MQPTIRQEQKSEFRHVVTIIGSSPAVQRMRTFARRVGSVSEVVLLQGENGTGKEVLARAIHKASGLPGDFVPVNCATLTDALFESELFGYERSIHWR